MLRKTMLIASTAIFAASSVAAGLTATAVTDLNIRSGPGPHYDIVGVISGSDEATVDGCIEESNWCKVMYNGAEGWAYGAYLTTPHNDAATVVTSPDVVVKTVTYDNSKDVEAAAGAGAVGAVAGALIAGPIGAVAGGLIAGGTGALAQPDDQVVSYVRTNSLDTLYLEGEVVTGAVVPETVVLSEIPDSELRYVYVNGQPILVDPTDRRIVYVVR